MSEQQVFQAPNLRLDHLAQAIGDWYRAQKFDVQVLPVPGEGMVVQAKQQEGWRNALGMSSTLNIGLRYKESTLIVEIGAGKWADKAIAGGGRPKRPGNVTNAKQRLVKKKPRVEGGGGGGKGGKKGKGGGSRCFARLSA